MADVSGQRVLELAEKYIEIVPDDADPNALGLRKDVSMQLMRELGVPDEGDGMAAYVLLHYFIWREQIWCRRCGCPVLSAWIVQHWEWHRPRFGF